MGGNKVNGKIEPRHVRDKVLHMLRLHRRRPTNLGRGKERNRGFRAAPLSQSQLHGQRHCTGQSSATAYGVFDCVFGFVSQQRSCSEHGECVLDNGAASSCAYLQLRADGLQRCCRGVVQGEIVLGIVHAPARNIRANGTRRRTASRGRKRACWGESI